MNEIINGLYWLCTDLMIHAANLLHVSYFEANFLLFCVLYPVFTLGMILLYIKQRRRLFNHVKIKTSVNHY